MQLLGAYFEYWKSFTIFGENRDTDGIEKETRASHRPS